MAPDPVHSRIGRTAKKNRQPIPVGLRGCHCSDGHDRPAVAPVQPCKPGKIDAHHDMLVNRHTRTLRTSPLVAGKTSRGCTSTFSFERTAGSEFQPGGEGRSAAAPL